MSERGRFAIALVGRAYAGETVRAVGAAESQRTKTPWDRVHLFWGDERYVPHTDPLSNYRMARETLIAHVPIPAANVHPMPSRRISQRPTKAAEAYEAELRKFFGVGAAGVRPAASGLGSRRAYGVSVSRVRRRWRRQERWVAAVEAPAKPPQRLTLTPVVPNQARNTFFLVCGADKREIVAALRNEPSRAQPVPGGQDSTRRPAFYGS